MNSNKYDFHQLRLKFQLNFSGAVIERTSSLPRPVNVRRDSPPPLTFCQEAANAAHTQRSASFVFLIPISHTVFFYPVCELFEAARSLTSVFQEGSLSTGTSLVRSIFP